MRSEWRLDAPGGPLVVALHEGASGPRDELSRGLHSFFGMVRQGSREARQVARAVGRAATDFTTVEPPPRDHARHRAFWDARVRALEGLAWMGRLQAHRLDVAVGGRAKRRSAPPAPGPQPAPPPRRRADPDVVHPVIHTQPIWLVRKTYLESESTRVPVLLRSDSAFDGTGTFTCTAGNVRFFAEEEGGKALPVAKGHTLSGADLTKGVTLHVEAVAPSTGMEDVTLTLSLAGGSKQVGPQDQTNVTAVELTLHIYTNEYSKFGPRPIAEERKFAHGVAVPLRDDDWARDVDVFAYARARPAPPNDALKAGEFHVCLTEKEIASLMQPPPAPDVQFGYGRNEVVIGKAKPAAFPGTLVLTQTGKGLAAFEDDVIPIPSPLPVEVANVTIGKKGRSLYVEGRQHGVSILELRVAGIPQLGDAASVHVVSASFSESADNAYGYDDMDGVRGLIPHISVKSGGSTHVSVRFRGTRDRLVLDSKSPALSFIRKGNDEEFEVELVGAPGINKLDTMLLVRTDDANGAIVAALGVHIYRELTETIVLARVEDPGSPRTKLDPASRHDPKAVEALINRWLKPMVVRAVVFESSPPLLQIPYDLDDNGVMRLPGGRPEFEVVNKHIAKAPGARVIIVAKRFGYAHECAPARKGDSVVQALVDTIRFMDGLNRVFEVRDRSDPKRHESVVPVKRVCHVAHLKEPLKQDYPNGLDLVMSVSGKSGSPACTRESKTVEFFSFVVAHEIAHHVLGLYDVLQFTDNLMDSRVPTNLAEQRTSVEVRKGVGRLRWRPVQRRYKDQYEEECQWDEPRQPRR